jgi:16S rRNA A1518/A1519 N6-dimethyltransferase RsmA/KsgA/DIM1 with predicted DNA glycosylase/AP lyase activity
VVQITPKPEAQSPKSLEKIEKLTAKLFGQRRKMIRGIMPDIDWARFELTGAERAEQLSPETFVKIADAF